MMARARIAGHGRGAVALGAADVASWVATARRVMKHPRSPRAALLAYQDERLRAMVRHAGRNVACYRDLFAGAGVDPEAFGGRAELEALPRIEKPGLRRPRREILAAGTDTSRIHMSGTSGSSGNPFGVWRTREEARVVHLFRMRAHRQMGIGFRDRICSIVEPRDGARPRLPRRILQALGMGGRTVVSCFRPLAEIVAELERLAPDVVSGYPSALSRVGSFLAEHGHGRLRPRVVYTGGEPLDAGHRRRIENGFGARVFDVYGAIELDVVAWQCPEGAGLHLCEDNFVPEILKDGRPVGEGEVGELVITALHNRVMPLVRYGLGDLVERGPTPCPCGQPFATLTRVYGRTIHYLELPGREPIHPFVITGPLIRNESRWIDRHQLVQESPGRITLRIAPLSPPPEGSMERMASLGRGELGAGVDFRIELVDGLPAGPSGKFQPYLSLLDGREAPRT